MELKHSYSLAICYHNVSEKHSFHLWQCCFKQIWLPLVEKCSTCIRVQAVTLQGKAGPKYPVAWVASSGWSGDSRVYSSPNVKVTWESMRAAVHVLMVEEGSWPGHVLSVHGNSKHGHLKERTWVCKEAKSISGQCQGFWTGHQSCLGLMLQGIKSFMSRLIKDQALAHALPATGSKRSCPRSRSFPKTPSELLCQLVCLIWE